MSLRYQSLRRRSGSQSSDFVELTIVVSRAIKKAGVKFCDLFLFIEWLERNFSHFSLILSLDFSEILNICQNYSPFTHFISFCLIQAVQDSIERQREAAKRRIEEKRRKRDEKQYEEDLALSILSTADKNLVLKREKTTLQKSKQSSSVSVGELALVLYKSCQC